MFKLKWSSVFKMNPLHELRHFPEFVKLSHSVFALPFALAALVLAADGLPSWITVALVSGAVVTARFAAMAFNRIVDLSYDAKNPRTANRHLPTGQISLLTAWGIVVTGCLAFIFISSCINPLAAWLSPVALVIVLGYSFTKRFTHLSHFFLGAALSLAPLGAWIAVEGNFYAFEPWMLALAVMCWVAGFDMIYALQDLDFDRHQGLYSIVVSLGPRRTLKFVRFLHMVMFFILVGVGLLLKLQWLYFAGLTVVLSGLIWEHWLMRRLEQDNVQKAFLGANAIVSFGYLAAVLLGVFTK